MQEITLASCNEGDIAGIFLPCLGESNTPHDVTDTYCRCSDCSYEQLLTHCPMAVLMK
jgi:hypothetical protein